MTARIFICFGLLLGQESFASLLDWLCWAETAPEFSGSGVPLLKIPFEELKPEERFLIEASKITGLKLDQLDVCQHKLIMKLKDSCGSLSDEALAKLSVNLLNCQADLEGRRTYSCNENMRLSDCTKDMDPETWNAYHIMSNRARAVCYVARQEQFRALAEMTVNKLVDTARTHLQQMSTLNENQGILEKATQITFDRISNSQREVLSTYSRLRRLESDFAAALSSDKAGLEQLSTMIDNGRNEIINNLDDLKNSIGEAEAEFKKQREVTLNEHAKVKGDLLSTQTLALELKEQLGTIDKINSGNLENSLTHFELTQKYLKAMNQSLNLIFSRLEALEKIVDNKTSLVLSFIGSAGDNIDTTLAVGLHILCLSSAMLLTCFLGLPKHLRPALVALGILNIYLSLHKQDYALSLPFLYISLIAGAVVDILVLNVITLYSKRSSGNSKYKKPQQMNKAVTSTQVQNGFRDPLSRVNDWLADKNSHGEYMGLENGILPMTPLSARADEEVSERSTRFRTRRNASPSRSLTGSTTSTRKLTCTTIRMNGVRCKLPSVPGGSTCHVHQKDR